MNESIIWDKTARENFDAILGHIPVFLRSLAEQKVSKKAEKIAQSENRLTVIQKDVIDAFFIETPFGFHGPMKADMQKLGIDYRDYGYTD